MNQQKVLIFDIETAPMLAFVWGIKDQVIGLNQVYRDWHVLAWAAKWLGDPASKVMYQDQSNAKDVTDDKKLLQGIWELLDEADIVITQNGKSFDSPKLNARFIEHGMKPPSPYKHLDTYQIVKSVAKFTSNKLEYLTDKLCVKYKKLDHKSFPGMSLWKECLAGNKKAWAAMKEYNIHDVFSTEEFYEKIKAWAPQNTPRIFNLAQVNLECRTCGGNVNKRGLVWRNKKQVQQVQCRTCGAWDTRGIK